MNTDDIAVLGGDEKELGRLVAAFVRTHHRLPSQAELEACRRVARGGAGSHPGRVMGGPSVVRTCRA